MALDIVEQERAAMPMQHLIAAIIAAAGGKAGAKNFEYLQRLDHELTDLQKQILKQWPA